MEETLLFVAFGVVAVILFVVMKKRSTRIHAVLVEAPRQIEEAYKASPQGADEVVPKIFGAYLGEGMLKKVVVVGITNRRVFLVDTNSVLSSYSIADGLSLERRTFSDQGNDRITYIEGWSVNLGGGAVTLRVHPMTGTAEEAAALAFLQSQATHPPGPVTS